MHYNSLNSQKVANPEREFTTDIEAAFSANPNRLYANRFYDLAREEVLAKVKEIRSWYNGAKDAFEELVNSPLEDEAVDEDEDEDAEDDCTEYTEEDFAYDGEEDEESEANTSREYSYGDVLNILSDYIQGLMPVAIFLRKNKERYSGIVEKAKRICYLFQNEDPDTLFRVITDPFDGSDLTVEIKAVLFSTTRMAELADVLKDADSIDITPTLDGDVVWDITFRDAYKVSSRVKNE